MAVIAEHAMHRLSGRLDAWPLTSWHRSRGGIAHSCPHTVVTAARCLQWGGCVRSLGMPGLPTRAVSSALPERPKAEGLWGHRDCMRISAHIWVGARCAWVSCERVYTDPWSRPRRARRARGWLRVSVQVRSRVIQYTIYLTQTQTARPRDLPVAARIYARQCHKGYVSKRALISHLGTRDATSRDSREFASRVASRLKRTTRL